MSQCGEALFYYRYCEALCHGHVSSLGVLQRSCRVNVFNIAGGKGLFFCWCMKPTTLPPYWQLLFANNVRACFFPSEGCARNPLDRARYGTGRCWLHTMLAYRFPHSFARNLFLTNFHPISFCSTLSYCIGVGHGPVFRFVLPRPVLDPFQHYCLVVEGSPKSFCCVLHVKTSMTLPLVHPRRVYSSDRLDFGGECF